ncbi:MAG: Hsp20/alpha crystallin family protein [Armatimonadota bacterium]|nr:Hsp20/alpha crystallin family protein [Armatimonadota bacterium]MCX7778303.1 Hsp20/alpha crystallin family protein [Armatimonadota bacterium]MDW8026309.1 Hsp20/alpha crystallin family protein [Armatimonadota bacterium]
MARRIRFEHGSFEIVWRSFDEWRESVSPQFSISQASSIWLPAVDMCETNEAICITVELAGVHPSDISVEYQNGEFVIRGVRRRKDMGEVKSYYRVEIDYGPFERRIKLPHDIDPDGITAKLEHGLLYINAPKRRSIQAQPTKVQIKEG